ncbi:hypothetical protein ACS9ZN_11065, partial [Stenotrophomonas pavanii]
ALPHFFSGSLTIASRSFCSSANRIFRMQGVHRMLLHAERLRFSHPDGGAVDVSAPLDREFQKALDLFGWQVDTV